MTFNARLAAALAIACATALALLLPAAPAAAHAIILDASPRHAPLKAGVVSEATLQFNSGIEVGLSRIMLFSRDGTSRTLEAHAGDKPGVLVIEMPALEAGQYALKCRVFAKDGHLTEENVPVRVEP